MATRTLPTTNEADVPIGVQEPILRRDSREIILHVTRLARGLTLLTGGTAYDTATETYLNPSDWSDRPLHGFQIRDHLRIEQVSGREDGRIWFHTRGLSKFGLDDVELYRPAGLSERPVLEFLSELAESLIDAGKAPNVGEVVRLAKANASVPLTEEQAEPLVKRCAVVITAIGD